MTSEPETIKSPVIRDGPGGCRLFQQKSLPAGGASVVINLYNDTMKEVRIYWIDYTGEYHDYGSIRPYDEFELLTTNYQVLLLTDIDGFCLGTIITRPNLQANVSTYITKVGCNGKLDKNNNKCKMTGRKNLDKIRGIKESCGVTAEDNGIWDSGWRRGIMEVDGIKNWNQWQNRVEYFGNLDLGIYVVLVLLGIWLIYKYK